MACSGSTVLVVWEDTRNGSADIAYRRSTNGGVTFGGLEFLVRSPLEETNPTLALSGNVALIAWEDTRLENKDLAIRRSEDGGQTWLPFTYMVRSPFESW